MTGYLPRQREHMPAGRETRLGSAVVIVGALLTLFCTLVTVQVIPALAPLHGKVSVPAAAMWLIGGMFIIRAGVDGENERWSPRALRIAGWSIIIASIAVMIAAAVL
jgi:hypothetical protein